MTPDDFNSTTSDQLQKIGAIHYFHPYAKEEAEALGIDGFRFYFCGRAGVLGEVSTEVMLSAFGYFEPGLVDKMWTSSKERCDVVEAGRAQMRASYRLGVDAFTDSDVSPDALTEAASSMGELVAAVDRSALPLFAGFVALDVPEDPAEAFMHQAVVMRELRGSVHLAALAATGLGSRAAHQIKRPNDQEMFGYKDTIEISDADRAAYELIEPMTQSAMNLHAEAISAEQRTQIAETVAAATAALGL